VSCGTSWAAVRKNTSLPLGVASRNADSRLELPGEMSDTQPPEGLSQVPKPEGSYS
jgi:hypothetical protein